MGRAPCCEKMGLKKGPWAPEEDQILIRHINTYGHGNWRALPKLAGLLRCGKSCRLRWTNYLRPDIKRGNFTREEEETIIMLHEMLGNRWSAIAARLPGRTDNEIKNVWHTHLKKRLPQHKKQDKKRNPKQMDNSKSSNLDYSKKEQDPVMSTVPFNDHVKSESPESEFNNSNMPLSPPQCSTSSEISTLTTNDSSEHNNAATSTPIDMPVNVESSSPENIPALDEDFWSEVFSADNSSTDEMASDFPAIGQLSFSSLMTSEVLADGTGSSNMCDSMEFWYDLYAKAEDITEFLEL